MKQHQCSIRLAPSHLQLDFYAGEDFDKLAWEIDDRYDYEFDDNEYSNFIEVMKERKGFCHQVYEEDGTIKLLVWVRDINDMITLSHEIIHATWYIQKFTGFNFSYESQEMQCYLHDYIVEQILVKCLK